MPTNIQQLQLVNTTGLDVIPDPLFNDQECHANDTDENCNMVITTAVPISYWNPEHVEGSSEKKRTRTSSELEEEIHKDFSIFELFKTNNIEEINAEATIDPEKLQKNLKGWKIKKRKRGGSNGNERKDQFYCHEISTRKLRSLVEVRRCVEENSYLRNDSDNPEGSKVDLVDGRSVLPNTTDEAESHGRVEELVIDNKLSKKSKAVTCSKCHKQGHNARTCKG
ncbi:hypothetical protein Lser_V15G42711 [Lactuca serriola]